MLAAYCAAKAGVAGLVRALAVELRGTGVTANAVAPGSTDTPMLDESARLYGLASAGGFAAQQPIERLLEPEEVAAMLVWLASPSTRAASPGADPGRRRPHRVNIVLDPRARLLDGGRTLVGGDPWRVLRLTEGGAAVVRELLGDGSGDPGRTATAARAAARGPAVARGARPAARGAGDGAAGPAGGARGPGGAETGADGRPAQALAQRLIHSGLAHPRVTPVPCGEATVVIPVRDRAAQLDRCLGALLAADAPGR